MSPPVQLSAPYETIDRISNDVLEHVEDEELGHAILGVALTLGRLLSVGGGLGKLNEVEFVSTVLDYAGAYIASAEGVTH